MARPAPARMTYAEYLAAEAVSEVRHEFLNGEVWAMAGGTPQHGALAGALTGELLEARPGEAIELASLGMQLDVAAVYA